MVRRRVIVHGRVQGVGYRYALARAAETRGVAGWVRNRPDGTVEAVLEGRPDAVESLVRWCTEGPHLSGPSSVNATREELEGLVGFEIR